jgi:hypothetical protein
MVEAKEIMPRGLIGPSLVSLLFLLTASTALSDGNEDGHAVVPLPTEIFGIILSEDIPDGANLQTVMDQGVIQKWKTDLKIYIAHENESEADPINHLIETQLKPLMLSVSEATGLGFKRVNSLSEANVVFVFAEKSSDAERFLETTELREWFGARDAQKFDDIEAAFRDAPAFCFRFTNAPDNEITRAIGFTSTAESIAVQEKCLARNLLFAVGLSGQTDSPASAKSPETSSRSIGLLDEMALDVLYREGVEPGMTLRQALSR